MTSCFGALAAVALLAESLTKAAPFQHFASIQCIWPAQAAAGEAWKRKGVLGERSEPLCLFRCRLMRFLFVYMLDG